MQRESMPEKTTSTEAGVRRLDRSGSANLLLAMLVCLNALAPSSILAAAEGELTGLGQVKFGMSQAEVMTVLGPSARTRRDYEGRQVASGGAELGSTSFIVTYFFDDDELSTIQMSPINVWETRCRNLALDVFNQLEREYGKSDHGLRDYVTIPVGNSDVRTIEVARAEFNFENGAIIRLDYSKIDDRGIHRCQTTVEMARSEADRLINSTPKSRVWDWFSLFPWF